MEWAFVLAGVFAIFIPALMLPGPDFVAVVRSSMTYGTRAGLLTTFGVTIGLGTYAAMSLVGLSAIMFEYHWLSWAIRICGGCYLAYLGIGLLFTKPERANGPGDAVDVTSQLEANRKTSAGFVRFGLLVALTNPKAIVLFASVFATAVTEAMPTWVMITMVGLVCGSTLAWYACVSVFMSSAPVIKRFHNMRHWIERLAGVCFVGIGAKLIADARNPITP